MAKYTTEVRSICEQKAGLEESKGFNDIDTILDASWDKIFTTHCTIFDEQYRSVICKKILKHYYTREIGLETVGLWMLFMNRKLEEILPYYNQLYNSELIQFNPMHNMDLTKNRSKAGQEAGGTSATGGSLLSESIIGSKNTTGSENKNKTRSEDEDITVTGQNAKTKSTTEDEDTTFTSSTNTQDSSTSTSAEMGTSERDISRSRDNDVIDTGASRDSYSDTPQGTVSNVEDNSYLTNYRRVTDNRSNVTDEAEITNDDTSTSMSGTYTDSSTGSKGTIDVTDKGIVNNETENDSSRDVTDRGITGTEAETKQNVVNESDSKSKMNTATNNSTTTSTLSTTESYIETVVGNNGSYNFSRLLQDFRDTFLNIDMMVINEFKGLFMGLW